MKANEIQIMDWVMVNDIEHTHPLQVAEIFKKCGTYYATIYWDGMPDNVNPETLTADVDKVLPIPLTKIHLTKNGFEAREETDDTEFYYYDCYEINVSFDEGISEENIPPIIFLTIEFAEKSIAMPIEYVHELQQAMRLMGCDKEIEL